MSKVRIDTPWGTTLSPEDRLPIAAITTGLVQLMAYKNQGKSTDYLERDIQGYQQLLASESVENCRNFMEVKMKARMSGKRFADNLAILDHMKEKGLWK